MTVRDLLSPHLRAPYGFMERTNVDAAYRKLGVGDRTRSGYAARDMVEELAALPLEFSPGTRWNYSVSTDVVGHLIELISGQRLDAYLREHVLQPLGMTDTSFVVTEEQSQRFAANYQRLADDSLKLVDDPAKSIYRDCAFFSGGGGLVSTANDYFRFASMMLNKGEDTLDRGRCCAASHRAQRHRRGPVCPIHDPARASSSPMSCGRAHHLGERVLSRGSSIASMVGGAPSDDDADDHWTFSMGPLALQDGPRSAIHR